MQLQPLEYISWKYLSMNDCDLWDTTFICSRWMLAKRVVLYYVWHFQLVRHHVTHGTCTDWNKLGWDVPQSSFTMFANQSKKSHLPFSDTIVVMNRDSIRKPIVLVWKFKWDIFWWFSITVSPCETAALVYFHELGKAYWHWTKCFPIVPIPHNYFSKGTDQFKQLSHGACSWLYPICRTMSHFDHKKSIQCIQSRGKGSRPFVMHMGCDTVMLTPTLKSANRENRNQQPKFLKNTHKQD